MASRRGFALLLTLLLLLAACSSGETPTGEPGTEVETAATETAGTPAESLATVRVGHVPITIYAPFYIALEKGYFAEEGLAVELMPVQGGTENVVQVAAGNFEVAGGGIGAGMLNAAERGVEFEIVLPMHTERPPLTSPFVVSKSRFDSGELTSMADMAGKTVAINAKGAATEYWLWAALQQGSLGFEDVTVEGVGFTEVAAALESGAIDGAILGEPLATLAEGQGLVARLSEDFLDLFTPTVVYFNKEWSTANPELAQGFVTAYIRGARDLNGALWYDEENLAIIEKYTNVPVDIVREANRSYHDPNGRVPVGDLETLQVFFMVEGSLSYDTPLDINQLVNVEYAERALERLGGPVEFEQ